MAPALPEKLARAGLHLRHEFQPGDLGELIRIHGVQNALDYGFGPAHEAYCARIAADFILNPYPGRSQLWLVCQADTAVGSVFIVELPDATAQLRLLFVHARLRGLGLGRWLVQSAVEYARQAGFRSVFLWTVRGLDRAMGIYEDAGFVKTEEKPGPGWGDASVEVRYELRFPGGVEPGPEKPAEPGTGVNPRPFGL
ncbi:MAG: GNAT family N-acetyltransferase [Verrucomicrobia bacterium]|nr:GNAT family N-acetyltransferase [Verrucomicrobiota bacterium]